MNSRALDELMQRAIQDKEEEPAFFRALLKAEVYAHAPLKNRSGRLRLIQFARPDGMTVLPFFSDHAQAKAAAGTAARIVTMTGRQLLEITRGATLMLNPNGVNCTLYPEEIAALLDRGEVATIDKVKLDDNNLWIGAPDPAPAWLVEQLIDLYSTLPCVEAAHLAHIRSSNDARGEGFLIALCVPDIDAERAARATITAIQPHCERHGTSVDLTTFAPGSTPSWLTEAEVEAFYSRSWGERMVASTGLPQ
jgi:hypothetical protein